MVNINAFPQNSVLNYDVFYGSQSWTYLTGTTTISGQNINFVDKQNMTIVLRDS